MDPVLLAAMPVIAWAITLGATGLSIALGGILAYHWYRYAMSPGMSFLTMAAYVGISIVLLCVLFATTLTIWVSA